MNKALNGSYNIEKELSSAIITGDGFNIYEIFGSNIISKKNIIDYGSKVNISFFNSYLNPEVCLGLRLNSTGIKTRNIQKSFYFIGRKNTSLSYSNPILFQDKSLLCQKKLELRDFYLGGNVYGDFFNTGFNIKKISIFDNEMASSINSFLDSCSYSFSKINEKTSIDSTVLDFSQKISNLKFIFNYNTPLRILIEKIIKNNVENSLFNCPKRMYKKILGNFISILDNNYKIKEDIKFVNLAKNGTFSTEDISDIYLEFKERRYFQSSKFNSFFIVKGKNNRIFLLDFYHNKKLNISKVVNIIGSYSGLAADIEFFVKAFSTEIFINEK